MTDESSASLKRVIAAPHSALYATIMACTSMVCLTVILWVNASDFDITEGKVIVLMSVVLGGREFVPVLLRRLTNAKDGHECN